MTEHRRAATCLQKCENFYEVWQPSEVLYILLDGSKIYCYTKLYIIFPLKLLQISLENGCTKQNKGTSRSLEIFSICSFVQQYYNK